MADQKGGIDWLKRRLYSRIDVPQPRGRRSMHEDSSDVPHEWHHDEPQAPLTAPPVRTGMHAKTVRTIFIGSVAFFVASIAVAALLFLSGGTTVSPDNIDIAVSGPLAMPGGAELVLQIEVTNNNTVPVKLADLVIAYPDGTRAAGDINTVQDTTREMLGTIAPGETVKTTARSVLFGNEDAQKQLQLALEFRIDGSNALFYKERDYTVILSSAPIAIGVDAVTETTSGQEVEILLTLAANSNQPLQDIILEARYPFGFEFRSAEPAPTTEGIWQIGDMLPGTSRTISIKGVVVGERNDERIFRFVAGTARSDNPRMIAAAFETVEVPIRVKQPFLGLRLAVNGVFSASDIVASRNGDISFVVYWENNLPTRIYDAEITAKLGGSAFDRTQVETSDGFYRSQDHTVIWNGETNATLSEIEPGADGKVEMTLTPLQLVDDPTLPAPTISIDVSVKARRLSEANVPETLESTATQLVRLTSALQLASKAVYSTGPFDNTGPVPPRAESETTYTIVWTVANSSNDVKDARVISRLPSYVTWTGKISPPDARVTYNPVGGEVMWDIGAVPARTGYDLPVKEVAFQVALTPSLSQVGDSPILVNDQRLTGLDRFTNTVIETGRGALNINLSNDPNFGEEAAKVIE
jgi:hypothetical protein